MRHPADWTGRYTAEIWISCCITLHSLRAKRPGYRQNHGEGATRRHGGESASVRPGRVRFAKMRRPADRTGRYTGGNLDFMLHNVAFVAGQEARISPESRRGGDTATRRHGGDSASVRPGRVRFAKMRRPADRTGRYTGGNLDFMLHNVAFVAGQEARISPGSPRKQRAWKEVGWRRGIAGDVA
jgi:hypothetical protein